LNVLTLRVATYPEFAESVVRPEIDGTGLIELVRRYEQAFAGKLAGTYQGLAVSEVAWPARHLLGSPHPLYQADDGRIEVLVCECGEAGCWSLEARISVTDATVTWSDFRQPHRPAWDYSTFGPFVFARDQYEAALRLGPVARDADA
jgi:hypothetical protein